MTSTLYLNSNTAIINFNQGFPKNSLDILNSNAFKQFIQSYVMNKIKKEYWMDKDFQVYEDRLETEIIEFLRQVLIYPLEKVHHPFLMDATKAIELVESIYQYWRDFERCSIIFLGTTHPNAYTNFIELDSEFNLRVVRLYRNLQEKLQGKTNKIYRQLLAGTNASITLQEKSPVLPYSLQFLNAYTFVDSVLLHSPLLLHPKTNKREGHFQPTHNKIDVESYLNKDDFYCYPIKIGGSLIYIYFHRDFIFSAISLANLFEIATTQEIETLQPKGIIYFGVEDGLEDMVFYQDKENDMVIAKLSYQSKLEYFGYMKKIILTVYNVIKIQEEALPIHGSMINIYTQDETIGVIFMGDSGAGKSEIIEEISSIGNTVISHIEVIFDDMGYLWMDENGDVFASGTEIGAFVRLDDLDRGLPYQQMDRSIFMNPESSVNARVIVPMTPYNVVSKMHPFQYFFYANNYENKTGIHLLDQTDTYDIFIEGKRMAKKTTHETGLTTSFFANPFGPLQLEAETLPLIHKYFQNMINNHIKIGEVYTNLGTDDANHDYLKESAEILLNYLLTPGE